LPTARHRRATVDSEILAAVEAKRATREQIGEWAKAFYAATRHGRMAIGSFYANAPDDDELRGELAAEHGEEFRKYAARVAEQPGGLERLREKTRAFAQVAKNVWNGFGAWQ
jgi:hypothetical protein